MTRFMQIVLLVAVTFAVATPSAGASPSGLDDDLAALWTTVLQTPDAQNPFGKGGQKYACIDLGGGIVAPFAPKGVHSCTVSSGTTLLVTASSFECSTFEGFAIPMLRDCARAHDEQVARRSPSTVRPLR
jgi:hypothetical protein